MTATMTDVAQAVTDELNAETWSQTFTANRAHHVQYALTDLATLRVEVVGRATDTEQFTRAARLKVVEVDVGVLKKVDDITNATLDPLVALVDEIADHFHGTRLDGLTAAFCTVSRPDPVYNQEHLESTRSFFSVLRLEFRFYP